MEDTNNKKDLNYYSIEIIKDATGSPIILVKFKSEGKRHWKKQHCWSPTLEELQFLTNTTKYMENTTSKIHTSKIPLLQPIKDTKNL